MYSESPRYSSPTSVLEYSANFMASLPLTLHLHTPFFKVKWMCIEMHKSQLCASARSGLCVRVVSQCRPSSCSSRSHITPGPGAGAAGSRAWGRCDVHGIPTQERGGQMWLKRGSPTFGAAEERAVVHSLSCKTSLHTVFPLIPPQQDAEQTLGLQ